MHFLFVWINLARIRGKLLYYNHHFSSKGDVNFSSALKDLFESREICKYYTSHTAIEGFGGGAFIFFYELGKWRILAHYGYTRRKYPRSL